MTEFFCKNSDRLLAGTYFHKKFNVWRVPKRAFELWNFFKSNNQKQ